MLNPIPILLYHSIAEQASPRFARWTVTPQLFESHMAYLRQAGYHSFTVTDYVSGLSRGNYSAQLKPVVITFDDGFADFYTQALPVLINYGMRATLFITTHYVGGTSTWLSHAGEAHRLMLSWEQVREVSSHGIECGAHGHFHHQLDVMPAEAAREDILQSKGLLEQHLARPVFSFAYPHGYYSQPLKTIVQQAGFTSACGVKHAFSSSEDDPFALARLIVSRDTDLPAFQHMLAGEGLPVAPYPERARTKAWRGVRWFYRRLNTRAWL
jgi:peptidoglycan/xylan/chitin deacetylase (PgdA/CDA1 family)